MGRRRQGQDRRPARPGLRPRLPLPTAARTPATRSWPAARRTRSEAHPARVILQGKECVIGAGCVVDPPVLLERARRSRLARASRRGLVRALRQRAPDHAVAPRDRPGERAAARQARRSAPRSAASARATPTRRCGSGSASRTSSTRRSCARRSRSRSPRRTSGSSASTARSRSGSRGWSIRYEGYAAAPAADRSPTPRCSSTRRLRDGKHVLFEGAHGTLLDLDHGTYPFVTSSTDRSRAAPRSASGSARAGSTACSGSRRPMSRASARGRSRPRSKALTRSGCASSAASTER